MTNKEERGKSPNQNLNEGKTPTQNLGQKQDYGKTPVQNTKNVPPTKKDGK